MTNDLLAEYKAYYSARAEKYAGNPNYRHTYEAEKRLADAMLSCNALDEFRDKIGDLNERCAVALTRDRYLMEKKHFDKHQETVRVKASDAILQKADNCKTAFEVISMVNEVMNKNMIEISMDEAHRQFIYDWEYVDLADIYEHAEVPAEYRNDMTRWAADTRKSIAEGIERATKSNRDFQPDWQIKPELMLEPRHRRLLPFSDEQIREHINQYKKIINL
jgi:DUF971 family protein